MKNKLFLIIAISAFGLSFAGCSASFSTGGNSAAAVKTTNTASSPAANKSANSASTADSTAKIEKPKTILQDEKKPAGTAKTASKSNPVPESWIYVYDESKGYGFSVPEGSKGEVETVSGVDVMTVATPNDVDIFVLSYKDKSLTKENLLEDAVAFLEEMGQKVTPGNLKAESDDYAVADAATVHPTRGKGRLRIMVGTDVTDNYVMILGTEDAKFAPNEKTIDEIWGSFEMWSGGASKN